MRIDLHLGAHRTGTTSFQNGAVANGDRLAGAGVAFWGPQVLRADEIQRFPNRCLSSDAAAREEVDATIAEFARAVNENARAGIGHLVLSDENWLGSMPDNLASAVLYPKAAVRLVAYRRLLPQPPRRIFLTIRAYDEYWASAYAFAALRNDLPPFEEMAADLAALPRRWPDVVQDIHAAFPESHVVVLSHSSAPAARLEIFHAVFGGLAAELDLPRNLQNRSFGAVALARALAMRSAEPTIGIKELKARIRAENIEDPAPFRPFTHAQAEAMRDQWFEDVDTLTDGNVAGVETVAHDAFEPEEGR